jgi:acyl carrier protein
MTGEWSPQEIEDRVRKIWAEVLKAGEGEEDATFFELQGQSISAARIVARVEDEFGVAVDIALLFRDCDAATLAREVAATARPA